MDVLSAELRPGTQGENGTMDPEGLGNTIAQPDNPIRFHDDSTSVKRPRDLIRTITKA